MVMQALKQGWARKMRAERGRCDSHQAELWRERIEHFWQSRFYDFVVWSKAKREQKLRYMHENPVKADWYWSPGSGSGAVFDTMRMLKKELSW